jgi:hypothetical protein
MNNEDFKLHLHLDLILKGLRLFWAQYPTPIELPTPCPTNCK